MEGWNWLFNTNTHALAEEEAEALNWLADFGEELMCKGFEYRSGPPKKNGDTSEMGGVYRRLKTEIT